MEDEPGSVLLRCKICSEHAARSALDSDQWVHVEDEVKLSGGFISMSHDHAVVLDVLDMEEVNGKWILSHHGRSSKSSYMASKKLSNEESSQRNKSLNPFFR